MAETEIKSINGMAICDTKARNSIPTTLSSLTEDSTHRTVTDTEKSAWNGKMDKTTFKTVNGQSITGSGDIAISGGSSYTLPIANSTTLGGVKPISKTSAMTKDVGVDSTGKLYTSLDVTSTEKAKWNAKMDATTFKTINNQTITGTGNISITSGTNVTVDTALSSTSTNPVQNKVIKTELDKKASTAVVTTSANGLMSKEDKTKLDGIADGANKTIVDSALNTTSTNPVQNKVIKAELDKKANNSDLGIKKITHTYSDTTVTINSGEYHVFPTMTSLTIKLGTVDTSHTFICGFEFTSGTSATSLTLTGCTLMTGSDDVNPSKTYEVNILGTSAIVRAR